MTDTDFSRFDTRAYRQSRIRAIRGQFAWDTAGVAHRSAEARAAWQRDFRRQFDTLLGRLAEWERPSLEPVVVETQQCDGYRREAVEFMTRPGLTAFGWFLTPDDCPPGQPAILCLHGHGIGADGIAGLVSEEYGADFAVQCARHGYPTLALEQIGFGRRRDPVAHAQGPGVSSCGRDSSAALMFGETMGGWRVWDAMRALDYLSSRTEFVAPNQLAVMGISGGGLTALFTAALDTRVVASVVSGYFNTFTASILAMDHCIDNYAPGLLRLCEMPDLAALIAPRALFVENGREDPIFPLPAFEQAVAQAREVFATFGVPERFGAEVFDGGHRFYGVGAFEFLAAALPPRAA